MNVEEALAAARAASNEEARWEVVSALHRSEDPEPVLNAVLPLLADPQPSERCLGANVMAQLRLGETAKETRFVALSERLAVESESSVLHSLLVAMGHLYDVRTPRLVLPFVAHDDCDVRFGVQFAVFGCTEPEAVQAAVALSADPDDEVRNWAVSGLTINEVDPPEVRAALWARIGDLGEEGETEAEAILGLAYRNDRDVLPHVQRLLQTMWAPMAVEAAATLREASLLPALLELRGELESWQGDELEQAIAACGG